jgi:hypothetical protein
MFIENKYSTWYYNIINKSKNRLLTGYKEKHHIIPKCLGGSNNEDNLVRLTAKEHFIVHMLLCKFTKGEAKRSMFFALNCMITLNNRGMRTIKYSSRTFEKVRKQCAKYLKGNKFNVGRIPSKETRLKISQATKGLKRTEETKAKMSKYRKGLKLSEVTKQKIANSLLGEKSFWYGKEHTQETKNKMSKKAKGRKNALGTKHPKEFGDKIAKRMLGNKITLGMICINKDGKTKMINKNKLKDYLTMGYSKGKIRRTQEQLGKVA